MLLLNTLYVTDHRARLRMRKRNLTVQTPEVTRRVPIETLEAVLLTGRAEITNETLGELAGRGIRVSAISKSGRLRFTVGGATRGNVNLRIRQIRAAESEEVSLQIGKWIAVGKLENCARRMSRWRLRAQGSTHTMIGHEVDAVRDRARGLQGAVDGDTLRGYEGDATRRYFKALGAHLANSGASFQFQQRSRRPPRDPVNAALSFVYGLLLTETMGALDAVGLDPQVGFLHRPRAGRASLALDLLEELRPSVADRLVVSLFARQQLRDSHFHTGPARSTYLNDAGRRILLAHYDDQRRRPVVHSLLGRSIPTAVVPTVQATLLARHLRGDLPAYPPFVSAR